MIAATSADILYLAPLSLPDSLESGLGPLGWDTARFAQELRKEIVFQFRGKGIAISQDSLQASRLWVGISGFKQDGGLHWMGQAQLIKPEGKRVIDLPFKEAKGAEGLERSDPMVDRIRDFAGALLQGARIDPRAQAKRRKETSHVPPLMLIF